MKRLDFRTVVVVLLAAAAGCKGDPTADLRTGVSQLALNPDLMFIDEGASKPFEVVARDQQLNPVAAEVTVTSVDPAVVTVTPDATVPSADNAHHDFIVTAVGPGQTKVVASSGAVSDSATVTVLPTAFGGAFSSNTPKGGDTLKIASTSLLKFSPADVAVTFGGGIAGSVVDATADTVKVLVPFGATGALTVDGIAVSYVPGLVVTLTTTQTATQTGDLYAGDEAYATAPTLAIPAAAGGTTFAITNFPTVDNTAICGEGAGPCTILKYVVAAGTDLTFTVDWDSDADLDIYSCSGPSAATCFEDGGAGAGSSHPEEFTFTAAAGTHYLVIENFDHTATTNVFVTVTRN